MLCRACFSEFVGASEGVPGSLLDAFSLKNVSFRISEIPVKTKQAQRFSRSRHPGRREKVTQNVVGIRWKI